MSDDEREDTMDGTWARLRATYNVPPETPREQMWAAIATGLDRTPSATEVVDLSEARRRRVAILEERAGSHRVMGWAVAAAAVLVLGIGIGRMTAPLPMESAGPAVIATDGARPDGAMSVAAAEHLGESESLLTMVRADAHSGRVDPATAEWANGLLAQTRMLLDARAGRSPAVHDLLLDLELVLVQIAGVAETGSLDEARTRTELALALRSLDEGEVLSRIRAVLPPGLAGI
jgi:hypothetical protein